MFPNKVNVVRGFQIGGSCDAQTAAPQDSSLVLRKGIPASRERVTGAFLQEYPTVLPASRPQWAFWGHRKGQGEKSPGPPPQFFSGVKINKIYWLPIIYECV